MRAFIAVCCVIAALFCVLFASSAGLRTSVERSAPRGVEV
jgi:hypothetical protein